jgi:hypothetical protein
LSFRTVQAIGHPAAIRDGKSQRLAHESAPVQSRFWKRKYGAQGSDLMKLNVKIPLEQRPIMFLMFGLALVFPWVFVGLRISVRDTMLTELQSQW